ncbi:hypothetical protein [Salinibius halmophilus]|uniref:hypothetical protein n=1 Tax=Salinibius halmophilus TaxID=1853216 RepID=UPI000E664FE3|nr:hypothetical protein [Salinibius halmophilus]
MGLFDKFKKAAAEPAKATVAPVISELQQLFGGEANVVDMRSCAHSRVRIELASPVSVSDEQLPKPFVAVHQIDSNLVHLIAQQDVSTLGLPSVR